MRILLIEDETGIANVIRKGLEEARYVVDVAFDGETGLERAQEQSYSLIILDWMLPRRDGLSICRALRGRRDQTPILMLTARDAVPDRVKGLEMGADDYLAKPFDFNELLARVRAQIRRESRQRRDILQVDDLEVDTVRRTVRRAGADIPLTGREYTLLVALMLHAGHALSRQMILDRVWMDDGETVSNTVDVYIAMLRRKIDHGHAVKLIQTVHGVGYLMRWTEED